MKEVQFSAFVERLYDAALDPAEWPYLLDDLSESFGGVGANFMNLVEDTPLIAFSPGIAASVPLYDAGWWRHDGFANYFRENGLKPGLHVCSDYFAPEILRRDMFQQDFQRRHGIGDCMSIVATTADGAPYALSIQRRLGTETPDADERRLFSLLGRHFRRAVEVGARLAVAESGVRILADRLARFDCAVAVVNRSGLVLQANDLFAGLSDDGLSLRQGHVAFERPEAQGAFDRLLARLFRERSTPGQAPSSMIALPRPGGIMPLLVQGMPLEPQTAERRIGPMPGRSVLLTVLKPEGAGYPPKNEVLRALGLTPGQARVALAIGAGLSVREASEKLGVSEDTTRSVLKQVYARLGVNRQSQLSRLVTVAGAFG